MLRNVALSSLLILLIASETTAEQPFRGGRMRPKDQQTTEKNTKIAKEKASSAAAFSPSPMLSAGSSKKTDAKTKKQNKLKSERRNGISARYEGGSDKQVFVFPADGENTAQAPTFYQYITQPPSYYQQGRPQLSTPHDAKYYTVPTENKNASSRFLTFNTKRRALDLGLSFSVPFFSIPMDSLLNLGGLGGFGNLEGGYSDDTALVDALSINWPTVTAIGLVLIAATFLLPTIVEWVTQLLLPNTSGNSYGYEAPNSYTSYRADDVARSTRLSPFTSLLEQLDELLAQYDMDASSCLSRSVCTYVQEAEDSVQRGDMSPTNLIIGGLSRSPWLKWVIDFPTITEAVSVAQRGDSCSGRFSGCPFSVRAIIKFLASYANK